MRNFRFLIKESFQANSIAEDLRVQLDINQFNQVNVETDDNRNEVIVQVPEADKNVEAAVEAFMNDYQSGIIVEKKKGSLLKEDPSF